MPIAEFKSYENHGVDVIHGSGRPSLPQDLEALRTLLSGLIRIKHRQVVLDLNNITFVGLGWLRILKTLHAGLQSKKGVEMKFYTVDETMLFHLRNAQLPAFDDEAGAVASFQQ